MYTAQYYIVEVAAALIGLSYPFIYQIIASLDSKYNSVHIVRLFRSHWINSAYNIALVTLMLCVVAMPFLCKGGCNESLKFFSFEMLALTILVITLLFMIFLFLRIDRFYDYIHLHKIIKNGIENDISRIKSKLSHSRLRIDYYRERVENAHLSEYWISDYDIACWNKKIDKYKQQIDKILNDEIPDNKNYRSLVDLLRFSIKTGDTDLYIRASSTFHDCVEAGRGHDDEK